jgi:hypothetical protein
MTTLTHDGVRGVGSSNLPVPTNSSSASGVTNFIEFRIRYGIGRAAPQTFVL